MSRRPDHQIIIEQNGVIYNAAVRYTRLDQSSPVTVSCSCGWTAGSVEPEWLTDLRSCWREHVRVEEAQAACEEYINEYSRDGYTGTLDPDIDIPYPYYGRWSFNVGPKSKSA